MRKREPIKHTAKTLFLLAAACILFAASTEIFTRHYCNTFRAGHWRITKDALSRFVMGTNSFSFQHYITDGSLDLSRGYGFNEIVFKDAEDPSVSLEQVQFDVCLAEKGSYAYFLFRKNENGCRAFRLSNAEEKENCYLRYSGLMEKEEKTDLDLPALEERKWYRVRVAFSPRAADLYIDKRLIAHIPDAHPGAGTIAFRCGLKKVLLDNVQITGRRAGGGPPLAYSENFETALAPVQRWVVSIVGSAIFNALLLFLSFFLLRSYVGPGLARQRALLDSLLQFLAAGSLALFVAQAAYPGLAFNHVTLFYFGQVTLPSLAYAYVYAAIAALFLMYSLRDLPEADTEALTLQRTALIVLLFFFAFPFFYSRSASPVLVDPAQKRADLREELQYKHISLDPYPFLIRDPSLRGAYSLYLSLRFTDAAGKLLVLADGTEFVAGLDKGSHPGFIPAGAPHDFTFSHARPLTRISLQPGREYSFRIVKNPFSQEAYLDGALVDRSPYNRSRDPKGPLSDALYLFPLTGAVTVDSLKVVPRETRPFSALIAGLRDRVKALGIMLLCALFLLLTAKKRQGLLGIRSLTFHLQPLILLLPFFILFFFFRGITAHDRFFCGAVLFAYLSIITSAAYRNDRLPVALLAVLLALLWMMRLLYVSSSAPADLAPAWSTSEWAGQMQKPPQQLEAFVYNNSLDRRWAEEVRKKNTILLLGSSQTWGAGSQDERSIISGYLETYLNTGSNPQQYKVINCGINGANSLYLGTFLDDFLIRLKPKLVVVNLSNNDYFFWRYRMLAKEKHRVRPGVASGERVVEEGIRSHFREALVEKIITPCRKNNIPVLLVKEPNSPENKDAAHTLFTLYSVLDALSAEFAVPLVSPRERLDEADRDSLVWWDVMHLSSLGQRILAQEIHRVISEHSLLGKGY